MAAARRARVAAHEAAVTSAVAVFFDRTGRAGTVRAEAKIRAERIMMEAETVARGLEAEADRAVARLRVLGEPVVEIATMTDQPVSSIRAALARAAIAATNTPANAADPAVAESGDPMAVSHADDPRPVAKPSPGPGRAGSPPTASVSSGGGQ